MAQQIEIIWTALGLTYADMLLVPAVFALVDAVTGFSTAVARRLKRPRAADLVLLIWIIPASWLALAGLNALIPLQVTALVEYVHVEDLRRHLAQDHQYLAALQVAKSAFNIVVWAQFAAAAVCLLWAIRLKRSVWVWLPLSLLANVGGLVWLLLRGRKSVEQA